MSTRSAGRAGAVLAAVAMALSGCATTQHRTAQQRLLEAGALVQDWSPRSRTAAAALLEEYGAPDRIESSRLTWNGRHLFNRVVVWDEIPGSEPAAAIIDASVAYRVPEAKRPELAAFSDEVRVSEDGHELAARAESMPAAALALNLANEIVIGLKTPAEARAFQKKTLRLRAAGKVSAFTQGLIFLPAP